MGTSLACEAPANHERMANTAAILGNTKVIDNFSIEIAAANAANVVNAAAIQRQTKLNKIGICIAVIALLVAFATLVSSYIPVN
jgi:hypothetical protein